MRTLASRAGICTCSWAEIKQFSSTTLFDFAADWQLTSNLRLLGGISNMTDRKYYNRVFQNGIEPGARRKVYAGVAIGL